MSRILVVDDEAAIRQILREILVRQGHQVECASNGVEALRFLQDGEYDLVLTDLLMPEMEGLEMIQLLRKTHSDVKIIAMTGGGSGGASKYLTLASAFGVQKTLMKPFSIEEVVSAVAQVLQ